MSNLSLSARSKGTGALSLFDHHIRQFAGDINEAPKGPALQESLDFGIGQDELFNLFFGYLRPHFASAPELAVDLNNDLDKILDRRASCRERV